MTGSRELSLSALGFRFGINGPHAARTMMLEELRLLFSYTGAASSREQYAAAVIDQNVLGKPTSKARELTLRYLLALYGLDPRLPVFRALRQLWSSSEAAQPLLALGVALARDPLLRGTQQFILDQPVGGPVSREALEKLLEHAFPERFSAASLKSFAQNVAGTWTAAGLLRGHRNKSRAKPEGNPEALALLLFLGYLQGRTGQRLFTSEWTAVLGASSDELESLATAASNRGLLVYMSAGGIKEVRFPGYLTAEEEQTRQEISHVV